MEALWQDVKYGARLLLKNPSFTLIAVATLALGIGANAAIFSVVNAVLLRPLPYEKPEQLHFIYDSLPSLGFPRAGLSEAEYVRLRNESRSYSEVAAWNLNNVILRGSGEPERISAAQATANLFRVLGTDAAIGRSFNPEEDLADKSKVVMLSHRCWQRRFGGDPSIIGRSLALDEESFTVIGVLPATFKTPPELQADTSIDMWLGFGFKLADLNRGSHSLSVIGRLREGVTPEQAQTETQTVIGRVILDYPDYYPPAKEFFTLLEPLHRNVVGDVRPALLLMPISVAVLLLIACSNVANLLLARCESRRKELAVRSALGASRGRIVRQLLMESLLLSLTGGSLGLLSARWGLDAILAISPQNIPRLQDTSLDLRVVSFTLIVSLFTAVIFGLAPAMQALRFNLHEMMKEGGRTVAAGRSRLRQALVVFETAMALVLLIAAGLLVKSYRNLQSVEIGFNPEHLLTMRLTPPGSAYRNNQQVADLYEGLLSKIKALPGVSAAAVTDPLPIGGGNNDTVIEVEGRPLDMGKINIISSDFRTVAPEFFQAMGLPLVRGRFFNDSDREGAMPVAVVNETLARNQWPNEDPIGKRFRLLDAPPDKATSRFVTVVGVAANAKNRAINADVRQEAYIPLRQHAITYGNQGLQQGYNLIIRTSVDPESLTEIARREIRAVESGFVIARVSTMESIMDSAVLQPRFNMILLGFFAFAALSLGAIGIYGVISYSVAQRTHEIGIRTALGAQSADVIRLVLGQGMRPAFIGVGAGLIAAYLLTRLMSSLLFGVSAADPVTFAAIAVLLLFVAFVACLVPARRAAKVDPMVALRYE